MNILENTARGSGAGLLAPPAVADGSGEWTVKHYFLVLGVLASAAVFVLGVTVPLGQPLVGALLVGLPAGLLILWKPEFGLYLLLLYVPFEGLAKVGPTATTLSKVLGIYTFGAVVVHGVLRRQINVRSSSLWLGIGFAVWSTLTIIEARDPAFAWTRALTRIQMIGLFFVAINTCMSKEAAKMFMWSLFLSAVVGSVGGLILPEARFAAAGRLSLAGEQVNTYAKSLVPGIMLMPYVVSQVRHRVLRWLLVGVVVVVFVALLRTGSRAVFAGALAGVLVGVFTYRGVSLVRRIPLGIGVLAGIGVVVALGFFLNLWGAEFGERLQALSEKGLKLGGRDILYSRALRMGLENPIMGVGVGNYVYETLKLGTGGRHGISVVHNDFLSHFAETGFPGLFLYVAMLLAITRDAWRVADARLRSGLLAILFVAVFASMANPSDSAKSYWLQLGACVVAGLVLGRPTPAEPDGAGEPRLSRAPVAGGATG